MTTPRCRHTATLLLDGTVLVAAGNYYNPLASAEIYDPAIRRWTAAPDLATARYFHTATLLPDGRVLGAGGTSDGVTPLKSAEIYSADVSSRATH